MPLDIYAALGALVRAEATRDREPRATAPDAGPDGTETTAADRPSEPDDPADRTPN